MSSNYLPKSTSLLGIASAAFLSSCGPSDAPARAAFPWLGQMAPGLTRDAVIAARGQPFQSIQTSPDVLCDTYYYNQPLEVFFVHVTYENNIVTASTDRHLGTCGQTQLSRIDPIDEIEIGMSRDEVFALLGPPVQTFDPGLACLAFVYNGQEDASFSWVFFSGQDTVEEVSTGHDSICGLY